MITCPRCKKKCFDHEKKCSRCSGTLSVSEDKNHSGENRDSGLCIRDDYKVKELLPIGGYGTTHSHQTACSYIFQ